jgi:hypothetical protein
VKRINVVMIACLWLGLLAASANADPANARIERREWRQDQRIHEGWRSGQLRRGERARLRAGERRIDRMEGRAWRDGDMNRYERRRITCAQNHESREIYRLKHNRRVRVI